jgi:hypothetical protein
LLEIATILGHKTLQLVQRYASYIQKLWMRAKAAYPGDGPDHPPYRDGVDTPCKNILQFLFHIHSSRLRTP